MSNGVTYYEDKVYLSFKSVWAVNSCGSTVGTPRMGSLVAMPTSSVYSVCAGNSGGYGVPYNFADLSGEVPASAWNCQPYCNIVWAYRVGVNGGPSQNMVGSSPEDLDAAVLPWPNDFYVNGMAVYSTHGGYCGQFPAQSWYKPWVVVPPQVRNLDPEWADCGLAFEGWYDPPTVLTPQSTAAAITTPTAPRTTSSGPSSDKPAPAPTTAQPASTTPPQTTQAPATTAVSHDPTIANSLAAASSSASSLLNLIGGALQGPASSKANGPTASAPITAAASSVAAGSADPKASFATDAPVSQAASSSPQTGAAPSETPANSADPQDTPTSEISPVTSDENVNTSKSVSAGPAASSVDHSPASTNAADGSSVQDTGTTKIIAAGTTTTLADQTIVSSPGDSGVAAGSSTALFTGAAVSIQPASNTAVIGAQTAAITTVLQPAASAAPYATIVSGINGEVTLEQQGSSLIAKNAATTIVVAAGGQATIGGQRSSVASSGGVAILDSQTLTLPSGAAPIGKSQATITGASGQEVTVSQQGSAYVAVGASSTVTTAFGLQSVIDGQTASAVSGGVEVVANGQTVTFSPAASMAAQGQAIVIVTASKDEQLTVLQQGSSAVIQAAGSTTTIQPGSAATMLGQTVSVPASGGGVLANGKAVSLSAVAVLTAFNGQQLTVLQSASSVVIIGAGTTTTIRDGGVATVYGQTISVASNGGDVVADGRTVSSTALAATDLTQAVATGSDGQQLTILQQGSSYVVQGASTTAMLRAGAVTTIQGLNMSLPMSGGDVVVDGQTAFFSTAPATVLTQAILTDTSGRRTTVEQQGSSFIIDDGTTKGTLHAGSSTIIEGQTFFVPTSSGLLVANGRTIALSTTVGAIPSVRTSPITHTATSTTAPSGATPNAVSSSTTKLNSDGLRHKPCESLFAGVGLLIFCLAHVM